jgi:hypothetical protein
VLARRSPTWNDTSVAKMHPDGASRQHSEEKTPSMQA